MKTISVSIFRREDYTKQVLDALFECVGIDSYQVFIHAEPAQNNKEVKKTIEVAKSYLKHSNVELKINEKKRGCCRNIYHSINHAFQNTDTNFHIHFEDDTVPSADCLLYYEWAQEFYKNNDKVATVSSYEKIGYCNDRKPVVEFDDSYIENYKSTVALRKSFNPWGWGIWRENWEKNLSKQLRDKINSKGRYYSWDIHTRKILAKDQGLLQAYPLVSRTQNIGAKKGTHCPGVGFHSKMQKTKVFATDYNVSATSFAPLSVSG